MKFPTLKQCLGGAFMLSALVATPAILRATSASALPPQVSEELNLTQEQQTELDAIRESARTQVDSVLTDDQLATLECKTGRDRASIPPGMMAPTTEQRMRAYANQVLPPPLQQLIAATQEPFVQPILDLGVPQMAFGRIALVGDAAFIPRPHTAAGVSKGAANAITLADALVSHNHDVPQALDDWEIGQLRLGMHLWRTGQALGDRSQFTHGRQRSDGVLTPR